MVTKTGLHTDSIVKSNYVTIRPGAETTTPTGNTLVCTNNVNQTTDYTTISPSGTTFVWDLYPANAGTVTDNGASCTIHWANNWNGTASLRVRASNDCGLGDWTDYMDIICTSCVGLDESQAQAVRVYPNPASKDLNVLITTGISDNLTLKLMNAVGKVVYTRIVNTTGNLNQSIDVRSLNDGMYFINIEGKKLNYSQKVTIQH